jgi:hypothetical protein
MAMSLKSHTTLSNCTVLNGEHGGGFDPELVYARVMALIDEIVLRDARGFDPDVWRQTVALFDELLQEQFPTRRPVQEHRLSAKDGAPLGLGTLYRGNAASSTRATCRA